MPQNSNFDIIKFSKMKIMEGFLKILALIASFGCIEAGNYTSSMRALRLQLAKYNNQNNKHTITTTSTSSQKKLSVVGGVAANPGQFPSVVYIYVKSCSEDWYCTGTLIHYNYVITAATCIYDAEDIDVLLGEYDLSASTPATRSKSRVRIYARQWTVHDSFDGPFFNNLGLIQLPLFTVANLNITIIGMSFVNVNTFYVGNTATAVGWGETAAGTEPPNLLYTTLRIISLAECGSTWVGAPLTNIFCAKSPTTSVGQGLCNGDEGGPLIYQSLLIGITSNYGPDCNSTYPGIFVPITTSYNTWINQKILEAGSGQFWVLPNIGS